MADPKNIVELRAFLSALAGHKQRTTRLPAELHRLALHVAHGEREAAHDLVGDVLLDLLERQGQTGAAEHLLELGDEELRAAIRRRLTQVRAANLGSKSRLVKTLRAHVAAALAAELPAADALPLALVVGDRLNGKLVAQAVAYLLAHPDAPPREPKVLAAELLNLYFAERANDVRAAAHGVGDVGRDDEVLAQVDAGHHVEQLRHQLGPELARIVGLRAQGKTLAEISGGTGVSTTHERQTKALEHLRAHVQRYGLEREDLQPVLLGLAA